MTPGTRIVAEERTTRQIDGRYVEQTIIHWNGTDAISVDYRAGDVDLWADPDVSTSHDSVLTDDELRELLAEYDVCTHPEPYVSDAYRFVCRCCGEDLGR